MCQNNFMGIFRNRFKSKGGDEESIESSIDSEGASDDGFTFDVVGESFQRDHLVALLKKHGVINEGSFATPAMLELEPTNDFDPTAVKVMVEGVQVGYIPKVLSGDVTKKMKAKGVSEFEVPGMLGWDTNNPMPLIGVRLNMSEFEL
jgi:hypothetical protein